MAGGNDELRILVTAAVKDAVRDLGLVEQNIEGVGRSAERFGERAGKLGSTLTRSVTLPLLGLGAAAVKFAADIEKQQVAFGVLLKDVERGNKLFERLKTFSAETPLQLDDINRASQTLLAFGTNAEDVVTRIRQIGDVAQGDADKLNRLTQAFGRVQAKGRASLEEINIFLEAGVPLIDTWAQQFGVAEQEVFSMISSGQLGFRDLTGALESLTGAGGQFEGMMEKISQTTAGKTSTAIDNLKLGLADLGAIALPTVNDLLDGVTGLAREFADLDDSTKRAILGVAGLAAAAGPAAIAIGKVTRAVTFLGAHPVVIGVTALAAAVAGIAIAARNAREARTDELLQSTADALRDAAASGRDTADAITSIATRTGLTVGQVITLAEQNGLVTDEIRSQVELLREHAEQYGTSAQSAEQIAKDNRSMRISLGTAANSLGDMDEILITAARRWGISLERVIAIGSTLDNLTPKQREQLELLEEQVTASGDAARNELNRAAEARGYLATREKLEAIAIAEAEAAERRAKAEEESLAARQAQERIDDAFLAARAEVVRILESEKTEYERIQEQIDYLNAHDWAKGGRLEEDRLRALEILQERLEDLAEQYDETFGPDAKWRKPDKKFGEAIDDTEIWNGELEVTADLWQKIHDSAVATFDRINQERRDAERKAKEIEDRNEDIAIALGEDMFSAIDDALQGHDGALRSLGASIAGMIGDIVVPGLGPIFSQMFTGLMTAWGGALDALTGDRGPSAHDRWMNEYQTRMEELNDTLQDEIDLRNEKMRELDRAFGLEFDVLRDQWERNRIDTSEFVERMEGLNDEYERQEDQLNEDVAAIRDAIEEMQENSRGPQVYGPNTGGLRRAADGADFFTTGPQLLLVGDNASGREHVRVDPMDGGGYAGGGLTIVIEGDIYGIDDLYGRLEEAGRRLSRRGRIAS